MESPRNSLTLRFLLILSAVVGVIGLLAALWALGGNVFGDRSVSVSVSPGEVGIAATGLTRDVTEAVVEVQASPRAYLVTSLGRAVQALSLSAMAVALGLAINSTRYGESLTATNVSRLRIAATLPVTAFFGSIVAMLGRVMAAGDHGLDGSLSIGFGWLLVSLVLWAAAEVSHYALAHRREIDQMA